MNFDPAGSLHGHEFNFIEYLTMKKNIHNEMKTKKVR